MLSLKLKEVKASAFVRQEEIDINKDTRDHSKMYILPSIKTRYFSMLIDLIVIVLLSLGSSKFLDLFRDVPDASRGILFFVVIILYEPILVSVGATVGQLAMDIRVRDFTNPLEKVFFPLVMIRFIVKMLLGWISFITITFNPNRRAIHDYVSGSVVIVNRSKDNPAR